VPDALFARPRLAPVYDAFDGERDDLPAYLAIAAELSADRVIDTGCGTGSLAVLLVSFRCACTFPADRAVLTSDPALRFRDRDETGASPAVHGDRVRDARLAPDRPGREFACIAGYPA
jgi:hypothetical protein